jgi:hypothetical protein
MNAWLLMTLSLVLLLAGFLVPFLMVMQILEPGFVLSFSAHFSSLAGLLVGLYGAFHLRSSRRQD